jgi:hypothetical protein
MATFIWLMRGMREYVAVSRFEPTFRIRSYGSLFEKYMFKACVCIQYILIAKLNAPCRNTNTNADRA